jgi:hypothetical protein
MWIFLTRRLRQWLVLAVAVPAVLAVVRMVRTRLERRSGQTGVTGRCAGWRTSAAR